ncbi:unnamed protein product, partial [Symbiodinium necroappetens]
MERFMRAVPFWQPLQEKEILPTAESDLEEEMMGKRWRDAALGALLLIGVAVAMAQFFAAVGNCVAQRTASKKLVASRRNASVLTVAETRPMLKAPEEECAGSAEGAETLVFPDCDSAAGTQFFCLLHAAVYYVLHNGFLLAGASVPTGELEPNSRKCPATPPTGPCGSARPVNLPHRMLMMMLAFVVGIMESAGLAFAAPLCELKKGMSRGTAAAGHLLRPLGSRRSTCHDVPTCEPKLEDDVGERESGLGHPGTAPATTLAKVLMSWCMVNNLMLGSAGIVWEAIGLWLVASLSAVLAVDVLGYLGRAIQALEMLPRGCVDWPEGAKPRDANAHVCPELVEAFVEQIWNTLTSAWATSIFTSSAPEIRR